MTVQTLFVGVEPDGLASTFLPGLSVCSSQQPCARGVVIPGLKLGCWDSVPWAVAGADSSPAWVLGGLNEKIEVRV